MMDKDEIITLSSDDENDTHQFEKYKPYVTIKPVSKKSEKISKAYSVDWKRTAQNGKTGKMIPGRNNGNQAIVSNTVPRIKYKNVSRKSPEIVDLVDCLDPKSPSQCGPLEKDVGSSGVMEHMQTSSNLDIIDINALENDSNRCSLDKCQNDVSTGKARKSQDLSTVNINDTKEVTSHIVTLEEISPERDYQQRVKDGSVNEGSNQNLKPFTEFVELCGSIEVIPNDRIRLTKKLMKRYGEADSSYISSQEFRTLIQKSTEKVNKHNLYLIAKDITDELSFRKKIQITSFKPSLVKENDQRNCQTVEKIAQPQGSCTKKIKKHAKFVKEILKKLDKLATKIRELEDQEVDLSDEEESAYVQLQRYRERFCQIYKKMCKYTNEIPNADRIYHPKICFTESKYPAINKCIEVWLNKTKRFPDFTDIMKLLESQSSSLGLPSNRESLRVIGIEIFQQVGAMLQRKRKYDLWDSLSGFLDEKIDPAIDDPVLEKILKDNLETRIAKEQEIFQHYSELQERDRLEPEEVPEEEANRSPTESGNEDEKEIEDIENNINKRLDAAINEDSKKKGSNAKYDDIVSRNDSENETELNPALASERRKESKNNYKNCKSLKWRSESLSISRCETGNSEDSNTELENEEKKPGEAAEEGSPDSGEGGQRGKSREESEIVPAFASKEGVEGKKASNQTSMNSVNKNSSGQKKCQNRWKGEANCFNHDCFNDDWTENRLGKSNESFDVHYCQVFADNTFDNFSEKNDGKKRKVFRDLTNVNRLMKRHGKSRNVSGLFAPSFLQLSFRELEKFSWRKRFKVNFRVTGSRDQKCALSQEGKTSTGKSVNSNSGGNSHENSIRRSSSSEEGRDDEMDDFFTGQGGESHEDGDEDRNKKNGRTGDDNASENEDEEEEEEDDAEGKYENETEAGVRAAEHLQANEPLLESRDMQMEVAEPLPVSDEPLPSPVLDESVKENVQSKTDEKKPEQLLEKDILLGNAEESTECNDSGEGKPTSNGKQEVEENDEQGMIKGDSGAEDANSIKTEKESQEVIAETTDETKSSQPAEKEEADIVASVVKVQSKRPSLDTAKVEMGIGRVKEEVKDQVGIGGAVVKRENESLNAKRTQQEAQPGRTGTERICLLEELPSSKIRGKNASSTSDEERVLRFLMHSPSSISITPPRKLSLSKPTSQAALQALATLRNLKGISATIVRNKPKIEDEVVVIGGSYKKRPDQRSESSPPKRSRSELPVISGVHSAYGTTPKIVTVQGNVSGFENSWPEVTNNEKSDCDSSSIRISNVWGSLPNNFLYSMQGNEHGAPGCSSRISQASNSASRNIVKKKNTKKKVEYVVLE